MTRVIAALLVLLAVHTPTAQQPAPPLLPPDTGPGDRLTVYTADARPVRGRLLIDNDGVLVLRVGGSERRIEHSEVRQVDRHRNRFLLGPLIGLGAGLAVGLPAKRRFDNEGSNGDTVLAICLAAGVGLGTVIDLFNGERRTIYGPRGNTSKTELFVVSGRGLTVGLRRTF